MAITQCLTNAFMYDILTGADLTTDTLKVALYNTNANLGPNTNAYTSSNEISGTGYTTGGQNISNVTVTQVQSGAYVDFDDTSWSNASFSAAAALIYNASNSNRSIAVIDFGGVQTVTVNTFTIQWPAPGLQSSIITLRTII